MWDIFNPAASRLGGSAPVYDVTHVWESKHFSYTTGPSDPSVHQLARASTRKARLACRKVDDFAAVANPVSREHRHVSEPAADRRRPLAVLAATDAAIAPRVDDGVASCTLPVAAAARRCLRLRGRSGIRAFLVFAGRGRSGRRTFLADDPRRVVMKLTQWASPVAWPRLFRSAL